MLFVFVFILSHYPENLRSSASHDFAFWRRGWDSNPRESFWPPSRFRVDPVTTTSVPLRWQTVFLTADYAEIAEKKLKSFLDL